MQSLEAAEAGMAAPSDKVAAAAIVMRMVRIMFMRPHLGAIR
jgi:hypothetical protein